MLHEDPNKGLSPGCSLHCILGPDSVFQDVLDLALALTLNFLDQSRVQIFPRYWGQAPFHNAEHTPSSWFPNRRPPAQRDLRGVVG